jgi:hypothetical protein
VRAAHERETYRNRWQIETRAFLAERKTAARVLRDVRIEPEQGARQHPQLLGAYLQVHAAELAAKRFSSPDDQRRFVSMVREAVASNVARGEPLPAVQLRKASRAQNAQGSTDPARPATNALTSERTR